jgi:hypothetical protein
MNVIAFLLTPKRVAALKAKDVLHMQNPTQPSRPTTALARNFLASRIATDQNVSLTLAFELIINDDLEPEESWHTLAAKCEPIIRFQFDQHLTLDITKWNVAKRLALHATNDSVRMMASGPDNELQPFEKSDLLPHYLLASTLTAYDGGGGLTTIWPHVRKGLKADIGSFWRWLAQEVRKLPFPAAHPY